ncbi:hypothetical protein [Amycolatopsis anabasis]|uniref:hypothetical protein n=1 Tax=Amycolatopsis anabasis TaxID=1840409 RepID=UPI0015D35D9D|nr:hypothetical protein [Amycolatopsis anabasis]
MHSPPRWRSQPLLFELGKLLREAQAGGFADDQRMVVCDEPCQPGCRAHPA